MKIPYLPPEVVENQLTHAEQIIYKMLQSQESQEDEKHDVEK